MQVFMSTVMIYVDKVLELRVATVAKGDSFNIESATLEQKFTNLMADKRISKL